MAPKVNNFLIPNVSKVPGQQKVDSSNKIQDGQHGEFKGLLDGQLQKQVDQKNKEHGVRLSIHAAKRLQERNLQMDGKEYFKIKDAIGKLKSKGGQDSLIITNQAAYIVDVKNNTIVTAMDRESMRENVFTKIDSTLFVD